VKGGSLREGGRREVLPGEAGAVLGRAASLVRSSRAGSRRGRVDRSGTERRRGEEGRGRARGRQRRAEESRGEHRRVGNGGRGLAGK
jgi:hypothetical protein